MKKELKKQQAAPSCDWQTPAARKRTANSSRICRFDDFRWSGVKKERYKPEPGSWHSIARQVLVGNRGESPLFHLRYFEIAPQGFSSYERHEHEHVVICVRGRGEVKIGKRRHAVEGLDMIYIAPNTPHQFLNTEAEPFGFFCIVNAERDRPTLIAGRTQNKKLPG